MVFSTFLCVPFVRLLNSGWLRYHGVGIVLQHVLQTAFLAISVSWTFHRFVQADYRAEVSLIGFWNE